MTEIKQELSILWEAIRDTPYPRACAERLPPGLGHGYILMLNTITRGCISPLINNLAGEPSLEALEMLRYNIPDLEYAMNVVSEGCKPHFETWHQIALKFMELYGDRLGPEEAEERTFPPAFKGSEPPDS